MSYNLPKENKMGTMPIGKLLINMALPMIISMLVQALYNVVDSIYVSQISESAVTALSLAFPIQNMIVGVAVGVGVGINSVLSKSLGERNFEAANKTAGNGIILMLIGAAIFLFFGIVGVRPYFEVQSSVAETVEGGIVYSRICCILSIGIFLQILCERLLQSTGRTTLSMATQLTGAIINIVLDPILIFGLCGFPRMEVAGAALATVVGQIVAAGVAVVLNVKFNHDIHISLRKIRWHGRTAREIYRVGIPSIIMQSIGSIMTFSLNRILISFTEAATAVFGAYFKLQSFIFMPVFGLNNGMVPIVSYNFGAAREDRVKRAIKLTVCTAICIMTVGTILFETIPGALLGFFSPSEEMLAIGQPALRIIGLHLPLAGFCIIAGSVCQAIGNPVYSLITSVCRQIVVLIPVAWLLAQTGNLTLVWFAFPIAELMSLLMSAIFLRKTMNAATARLRGLTE